MMNNSNNNKSEKHDLEKEDVVVSISDLRRICGRAKKKIIFGALVLGFFTGLYALIYPPHYEVKASFREKGKNNSSAQGANLSALFSGNSSLNSNNEALSLLKSRTIMEHVVAELNLQADLKANALIFERFNNAKNNLLTEYALFSNKKTPFIPDISAELEIKDIAYGGEVPLHFSLQFLSNDTFSIAGTDDYRATGRINVPLIAPQCSFTVIKKKQTPLSGKQYALTLAPLKEAAINLAKKFTIINDKIDKNLILLTYSHPNRHLAAQTLNALMDCYRKYIKSEQKHLQNQQMDYLHSRQDLMENKLKLVMENHAATLASDFACTGFPDSNSAVEFLARTQQKYKEHLLNIDLELQHLQSSVEVESSDYRSYPTNKSSHIINQMLGQIRQLKQKADSIELALIEASGNQLQNSPARLSKQIAALEEIQQLSKEAKKTSASIDTVSPIDQTSKLFNDPKYMLKYWNEQLQANQDDPENLESCKANLSAYLSNLIHLLQVHEKAIHERLTHQQNAKEEFQGIDLDLAKQLYIDCSKELNDTEGKILQHQCVADQMSNPHFEISSLSTLLQDPVSHSMIVKGSELALSLQDQQNRSDKEQLRIKEALAVQKGFLILHLKQTIALLDVKKKMVQEKIHSLQNATLSLIRKEISVLQESLRDYISTRISGLKQEQNIIEQHQNDLQQEMTTLPYKWVTEKLIDQQMGVNKQIVEQVAKLVESKNIESNLELMQSVPLDVAFAPIHPKPPRIILFALIGALLGALMTSGAIILGAIAKGLPASLESLQLHNQHVSGTLSQNYQVSLPSKALLDQDLNTFRRIITFLNSESSFQPNSGQTLLIVTGQGPDYSKDLATIMSKKGLKVLLMPLSFDRACQQEDLPGLLQYLDKKVSEPKIKHLAEFDIISAGGICRFANELIGSYQFQNLLNHLQSRYDWIIAVSHAQPVSAEIEGMLQQFNFACISVTNEKLKDLERSIQIAQTTSALKKITFVIAPCIQNNIHIS